MRTDFVRKHAAHAAKIRRSKRQSKKNFVVYYNIYDDLHIRLVRCALLRRGTGQSSPDQKRGLPKGVLTKGF